MTGIRITTGQPSGTDCVIEEQMGKYATFELAIQSRMPVSYTHLSGLRGFAELFCIEDAPLCFFLFRHPHAELFMLKSWQKSDIFQMLHGGPLTGRIIFHELIDQNPETVAGSAHAQSHPAGRFSFSVAAVNAVSYTHLDVYKRQLFKCTD